MQPERVTAGETARVGSTAMFCSCNAGTLGKGTRPSRVRIPHDPFSVAVSGLAPVYLGLLLEDES